ncbi:MAG: tetratricopeptide repeat protein [Candidatus Tantalella remota]|nr:tetratricopeptide repeat protein [Candidatus Tantalella remota]
MRTVRLALAAAVFFTVCTAAYSQEESTGKEVEEFDFANGLFARGMYDMAISGYGDFIKKYPDSAYTKIAEFRIGECYFLDGKYDEALNRFNAFLKGGYSDELAGRALLRKGQIFYMKKDYPAAEKILTSLASRGGNEGAAGPARYYLSGIYFKQGDYTTSKKMLERLLFDNPKGEYSSFAHLSLGDIYIKMGSDDKAAEEYREAAISAASKSLADEAYARAGAAFYRAGKYKRAKALYSKILDSAEPSDSYDSAALGLLSSLYKGGEYKRITEESGGILPRMASPASKAQALFIIGNSYFQQNMFAEAETAYSEGAEKYPDTEYGIKSRLNVCWTLYKLGRNEECLREVAAYMVAAEDAVDEALYIKAKALTAMGRTTEALEAYRRIMDEFKDSNLRKEALYEMGWAAEQAGFSEDAVRDFRAFAEEYPDDERSPSVLLKAAQESFKAEDYPTAEKYYNLFLEKYSENSLRENVMYQLAGAYQEQGMYDKAINAYEELVRDFPESKVREPAVYWMGRAYQNLEKWNQAIKSFTELVSDEKGAYYARGMESVAFCYFQMGMHDKAAEKYYELIKRDPKYKLPDGVYRWVADFYLTDGQNERSLAMLGALAKNYPDIAASGEISFMFGENYYNTEDVDKAIKYFTEAVSKQTPSPYMERAYLGLGRAYFSKGDYSESLSFLNKALEGNKDNRTGANIRFEIGNVNARMMNFEEAAKQYMMVAILYEDKDICPRALYQAGESFEKAGDRPKALEVFRELIERYPENEMSQKASQQIQRIENELE